MTIFDFWKRDKLNKICKVKQPMFKLLQSKNKKAFEIQFNWIFVLVAGAAILIFFTVILVKQRNASELSSRAVVVKSIESIITGASISKDTTNTIDIPNSEIEVSCNKFSLGGVSKQYQSLILFAPGLINGKSIVTQTTGFSAPYKATNLLYITSPNVRYIIIGNNEISREINRSLPSSLKKEVYITAPAAFQNKKNYKARFIIFDSTDLSSIDISAFDKMQDSDVTALKVAGDAETGTVEFYEKRKDSWGAAKGASAYIRKASLLGAVYSDTSDAYECSMKNAFLRLNLVNKVYIGRTVSLKSEAAFKGQAECEDLYGKALVQLNAIGASSQGFTAAKTSDLSAAAKLLEGINKDAQFNSCPLVY